MGIRKPKRIRPYLTEREAHAIIRLIDVTEQDGDHELPQEYYRDSGEYNAIQSVREKLLKIIDGGGSE